MVSEIKKTKAGAREIAVDDVKRILEVGRLLLSVLTQAEVEMLTRHFQNELPAHHAEDGMLKAESEED